jgi:DNA-binding HxlR family transcriptional regulator
MELDDALRDRRRWVIGDACSMTKTLELLSTKTVFQVVRELFFGTTRFDDFVERIGASAPAVSRALKQLDEAGVVARTTYREEGRRARDAYRLTAAGEDLLPVFLSLVRWGDAHLRDGAPSLSFVDATTGRPVEVRVTADADAPAVAASDVVVRRASGTTA